MFRAPVHIDVIKLQSQLEFLFKYPRPVFNTKYSINFEL